jgi:hypothetical protein
MALLAAAPHRGFFIPVICNSGIPYQPDMRIALFKKFTRIS